MTQATPFWSISLYECEADEDDELQFDEDAIIKVTNAEDPGTVQHSRLIDFLFLFMGLFSPPSLRCFGP